MIMPTAIGLEIDQAFGQSCTCTCYVGSRQEQEASGLLYDITLSSVRCLAPFRFSLRVNLGSEQTTDP